MILIVYCSKEALQMQWLDNEGRTALHRRCDEGKKGAVLKLLPSLQNNGILKEELLRPDKMGRTPLCLAQAEQKRKWNNTLDFGCGGWEIVESDEKYKFRAATAKAMLEWTKQHAPNILEEVKKWLVF